jgi:hypothetical protein
MMSTPKGGWNVEKAYQKRSKYRSQGRRWTKPQDATHRSSRSRLHDVGITGAIQSNGMLPIARHLRFSRSSAGLVPIAPVMGSTVARSELPSSKIQKYEKLFVVLLSGVQKLLSGVQKLLSCCLACKTCCGTQVPKTYLKFQSRLPTSHYD